MVVVSSGTIGTPLVIQRSGIGRASVLEKAGIPVVVDLPGVGAGYMDHQLAVWPYHSDLRPDETLDAMIRGTTAPADLLARNDPMLSWNGQDVSAKFRPTAAELAGLSKPFQDAFQADFARPDKPMFIVSQVSGHTVVERPPPPDAGQFFALTMFNVHPYSRGHVLVTDPGLDDETSRTFRRASSRTRAGSTLRGTCGRTKRRASWRGACRRTAARTRRHTRPSRRPRLRPPSSWTARPGTTSGISCTRPTTTS
jgi:choline dehydrogenase-like flavoprotein